MSELLTFDQLQIFTFTLEYLNVFKCRYVLHLESMKDHIAFCLIIRNDKKKNLAVLYTACPQLCKQDLFNNYYVLLFESYTNQESGHSATDLYAWLRVVNHTDESPFHLSTTGPIKSLDFFIDLAFNTGGLWK